MKKKWWYGFLWLFLLFSPSVHSMAQPAETEESMPVLVLGEDLTEKEKETVLGLLGVDSKDLSKYKILTITNEEEREYLGSYVKPEIVGSRAVSCILLSPSEEKTGLSVSLQNIIWCTEPMYRKLLVEQGVLNPEKDRLDVEVRIAAPVKVSGTAAFVGIVKGCAVLNEQVYWDGLGASAISGALELKNYPMTEDSILWNDGMGDMGPDGIGSSKTGLVDLRTGSLLFTCNGFPGGEESPVEFGFTYRSTPPSANSVERNASGLGTQWTHSYYWRADIWRGMVAVFSPDGLQTQWSRKYGRGYQSNSSRLTRQAQTSLERRDGLVTVTTAEGQKIYFDDQGRAVGIRESNGSLTKLWYDGKKLKWVFTEDGWLHFQYEDGLLIQVTDSMGNQLFFTYTENRQMASVSSSMGHKLCFGYKGSIVRTAGDYLVSVENEEGKQILKAEYGSSNSAEVHRDSVYYLEGDGQPKRWFTYNPYVEEKNTCETEDGRVLIFDHSDSLEGQAEWNWYDREGKLIHQHRRPEWK